MTLVDCVAKTACALIALWLAGGIALAQTAPPAFDPADPGRTGYKLVFDGEFPSNAVIDMGDTRQSGFEWYRGAFFGHPATPAASISIKNGVLTLAGADSTQIATAAPNGMPQGWVGKVFGGGFFIEARIAFNPAAPPHKTQWPAFWSMAIEHMAGTALDTFEHYIEDDFFENDTVWAGANSFGGAMHDWFGVYKQTCPGKAYCSFSNDGDLGLDNFVIHVPPTTNWRQFHVFAQLWTPATPQQNGAVQYYFDNAPTTDRITWPYAATPAQVAPFGIIDQDHLVIILSTGGGQTMQVAWVRIWQKPADADDWTH